MLADLRAYILADAAVAALIAARLYYEKYPQNPVYPCCTYGVMSESVMNTHGSDSTELNTDIVQLDLWAETGSAAEALKDALKSRVNSSSVIQGDTRFGYIEWQGAFSGWEEATERFRQTITLLVEWSPV